VFDDVGAEDGDAALIRKGIGEDLKIVDNVDVGEGSFVHSEEEGVLVLSTPDVEKNALRFGASSASH